MSVKKLTEELSTIALKEFDVETHFLARAARGSVKKGLYILDKLDAHFSKLKKSKRNKSNKKYNLAQFFVEYINAVENLINRTYFNNELIHVCFTNF